MANGLAPVLRLVGKTNAENAVVVTGDTGSGTGGGLAPLANLVGTVDASNRLVVVFV
jgi:hypothetical protein